MTSENVKKSNTTQKSYKYIIIGNPTPLQKINDEKILTIWDNYKQQRFNYKQTIKNQHQSSPFKGPIHIDATFYMKASKTHPPKQIHQTAPSIHRLFSYLDHNLTGILYEKDCIISSVTLKKIYDQKPRTEITIRNL